MSCEFPYNFPLLVSLAFQRSHIKLIIRFMVLFGVARKHSHTLILKIVIILVLPAHSAQHYLPSL